eukprot:3129836-Alexandrium_andersonii.AAC.1
MSASLVGSEMCIRDRDWKMRRRDISRRLFRANCLARKASASLARAAQERARASARTPASHAGAARTGGPTALASRPHPATEAASSAARSVHWPR